MRTTFASLSTAVPLPYGSTQPRVTFSDVRSASNVGPFRSPSFLFRGSTTKATFFRFGICASASTLSSRSFSCALSSSSL